MNLHHLELFYYVAKHGGIMEAVRNIPYGVQQPAVSGQLGQLEHDLGQRLFIRRPFTLTAGGTELYRFIRPFFDQLPRMEEKLRGDVSERLRFAGPTLVLRHHLPAMLSEIRRKFPGLRFDLREASQPQVEKALQDQEIDLGITLLEGTIGAGIESAVLMQLNLVLLVPSDRPEKTAEAVLAGDLLQETLISFPETEPVYRRFREHLTKKGLDWPTGIELGSLDLIETYVQQRLGIGLSVKIPGGTLRPEIRELPLKEIPGVKVGILWRSPLNPVAETLLSQLKEKARLLSNSPAPAIGARTRRVHRN
ncbi:MAG: LysR family transcriptional regulator [Verrucomicrobiales bacterium]|nr:LysR family transcriptional regulator [Verrucomicrobiales bacterium]